MTEFILQYERTEMLLYPYAVREMLSTEAGEDEADGTGGAKIRVM